MKTRIVLAGLLAMGIALEVSAQRVENDDMYFRGKDRERNKSIEAEASYASAKTKKHQQEEETVTEDEDNTNPTDSYSARNVNPEYVSRANSEKASEDETNYYLEGYAPPASTTTNFNNSYYNNANWARNSYYANAMWNSPYYGMGYYSPWASPYYGGGFYDPWMSPYSTMGYGMGPSYGWRTGWSMSFTFGNYWSPWGYGYGGYPYYGGGYAYGYPSYYYGGGGYYNESSRGNYGKRPSRHSAAVTPTQRTVSRTRPLTGDNTANVNGRTRTRQVQDDYYVRPSRRNTGFNPGMSPSSTRTFDNPGFSNPSSRTSRTRDVFSQPSTPSRTPSYTPSYSPSRSSGGGGGGGGGGSSPRPRGRG